ncbi:lipopolysaccharide kinase InaA family protein [Parendozoicomonas haliclonae]|uniref:Lipopolysaccharide kinase (Kdo/WaaP) family protein n=1 Tax=Parendozoicomonas haliclonae TaxID=1960125 RepID=A0A1X7ADR8_9GAMM|nr:lipopolysaccharide kinase InaA family protein [Parendozoicomonas haliclonae]SMA31962.1 Lipopolysaccharide kinase (Kdo/WaaP) family protein [Parendozoicomonas haliclonae]
MQTLTATDYNRLREGGEVIEADHFGEKVLRLKDESFLKLFRRKRLLTSDLLKPYSQRFADNARELEQRGIPTVDIITVYRIPSIERTAVHYRPLAGETLRTWLRTCTSLERQQLARELGQFIARLHRSGVYFRSLHLGNVLMMPDGRLGLIDISDMRCTSHSIGLRARLRNFRHLARYREDMELLGDSAAMLAETYNDMAGTSKGFRLKLDTILSGE